MANDVFSYDEATADTAFGSLGSVASGLQGNLDDLTGFVNRVRANWEGDEMDLYDSIQQRWNSASVTVERILRSVQSALGDTTTSVKEMRGRVKGALQG